MSKKCTVSGQSGQGLIWRIGNWQTTGACVESTPARLITFLLSSLVDFSPLCIWRIVIVIGRLELVESTAAGLITFWNSYSALSIAALVVQDSSTFCKLSDWILGLKKKTKIYFYESSKWKLQRINEIFIKEDGNWTNLEFREFVIFLNLNIF